MLPGPTPGLRVVMATDDPGATQALTPPPRSSPSLDEWPCQGSGQGPGTTPLTGARVGLGDRVGQLCGVSGGLTADVWPLWPRQPQQQPSGVGNAKLSQPPRAKAPAPQLPRACSPPTQGLSSRPGVCKQSGQNLGDAEWWPQEVGAWALSSAAKHAHSLPWVFDASLGPGFQL